MKMRVVKQGRTMFWDGDVAVLKSKAEDFLPVVMDDNVDLAEGPTAGLFIGTAGAVTVIMANGNERILPATLIAGVIHPISVKRVKVTGTTAIDLYAIY